MARLLDLGLNRIDLWRSEEMQLVQVRGVQGRGDLGPRLRAMPLPR